MTRDLPQASSLAKVRELVDAAASGEHSSLREAARAIGLSTRHAGYYGAAATVTLGLLTSAGALTPVGRELVATAPRSLEERALFGRAIAESESVTSIAHDLLDGEGPTPEALTQRLVHAGLSEATARRRASTLLSWRRYVLERQASLPLAR